MDSDSQDIDSSFLDEKNYSSYESSEAEGFMMSKCANYGYVVDDSLSSDSSSMMAKPTKRNVRKITSDSEDEIDISDKYLNASSSSFTRHRSTHVDSDEKSHAPSLHSVQHVSSVSISDKEDQSVSPKACLQEITNTTDNIIILSDHESTGASNKIPLETDIKGAFQQLKIDATLKEQETSIPGVQYCSSTEYKTQTSKVAQIKADLLKCNKLMQNINLNGLPDKGKLLKDKQKHLEESLQKEETKLQNMVINVKDDEPAPKTGGITWAELQANSAAVVPRTFGQKAMATLTMQRTLTMDRLKNLHDSLATRPTEDRCVDDPKDLKVELMPHQKQALAWLIWRETQKPSGGILADDMGLGKTLSMISLLLKTRELKQQNDTDDNESDEENEPKLVRRGKIDGGTLVICPATLIGQWEGEVQKRCKRNLITVEVHHGINRYTKANRLAKYDMVITTYKLVMGEHSKQGPLYGVRWKRIILDEAHVIRNHKSQTSVAICDLPGRSRWALTGTPVHNKELDLYALLKFLRCSPFDDLQVWKRWVDNKNAGGQERLNTVMASIMLRRTKEQLLIQGKLETLPEKKCEVISVELDDATKKVYQKILIFSKTLFVQFLRQRTEKNVDLAYNSLAKVPSVLQNSNPDDEYYKFHKKILKMHGSREVKSHEILVLLLRLRQICCHPFLITGMLNDEYSPEDGIEEDGVDMDILDKLNNLNIDDDDDKHDLLNENEGEKLSEAASKLLNTANPVFNKNRVNEKIRVIKQIITEKVFPNEDKIIVVSQWASMLQIVAEHLQKENIKFSILDGKVPVSKRGEIVENFNNPSHKIKVLLLSLTAGGVGLNLVGANHLLLLDLHWNPQLESQAQDRIYRVGQKKTVFVYKIVTTDSIEERIKALQENKLAMATDILSGTKASGNKLSLNDLKMLFNVNEM